AALEEAGEGGTTHLNHPGELMFGHEDVSVFHIITPLCLTIQRYEKIGRIARKNIFFVPPLRIYPQLLSTLKKAQRDLSQFHTKGTKSTKILGD
ncbi:MAG: hypothetical protein KBT39_00915, partial [Bacteroidales bacterium]|nr:hypothetical protein [Bacteroidales bacterium]